MTGRALIRDGVGYLPVDSPDRPVDDRLADPLPFMDAIFETSSGSSPPDRA